ncbi:MAG: hypothetical protein AAGK79_19795 [Pseudomonadota bacterium]
MNETDTDKILAAVAAGFEQTEARLKVIEERQLFLEQKIDNRFDLLERMMHTDRRQDQTRIQELEVRVAKLEAAAV